MSGPRDVNSGSLPSKKGRLNGNFPKQGDHNMDPKIMPGSDYKPPPPQTSPEQNKRGAPNQVREKLFGGAGPIPILRAINNPKP